MNVFIDNANETFLYDWGLVNVNTNRLYIMNECIFGGKLAYFIWQGQLSWLPAV
jgi:hypothetical protein